jgi:serine/threonine protein kinase
VFSCGVVLFIILAGFPPFQHAMANDWWFHKIMTNQHALFWEAHCRTAYFSPAAKDLLNKMLDPNPEQRITLDGIAEHEWFQGNVLEYAELSHHQSSHLL